MMSLMTENTRTGKRVMRKVVIKDIKIKTMQTETKKQPSFFPRSNKCKMAEIWNAALASRVERPTQERDRLWASELGKPNIELFLKMRGVEPSNPPNPRSKRKFEAGNMFEWIIGIVLKRAGILKDAQTRVPFTYPGLLEVSGRIDFIAGGIPDYEHYKDSLSALELPEFFMRGAQAIIEHFAEKYPEGLADMPLEIKSCSSFMMDSMERTGNASKNHRLQLFHYLKSLNFPRGNVVYICRDDLRMFEVSVENPGETEAEYQKAIQEITVFYNAHKDTPIEKFLIKPDSADELQWKWIPLEGLPPLEKNIVWDNDLKKFSRNWGVEYSSYLTMLYGYPTQLEFEEAVMPAVARWNRVLGRIKNQDKMTPKNLLVIAEMNQAGFLPAELAPQYAGGEKEEEDTVVA